MKFLTTNIRVRIKSGLPICILYFHYNKIYSSESKQVFYRIHFHRAPNQMEENLLCQNFSYLGKYIYIYCNYVLIYNLECSSFIIFCITW